MVSAIDEGIFIFFIISKIKNFKHIITILKIKIFIIVFMLFFLFLQI